MALIDVSRAHAGMVLTADVLDMRGRILIPAGAELSDKHVRALPAWGIQRLDVKGDGADAAPALEEWALAAARAEVDAAFSLTNRAHPAMAALLATCITRAATRMQSAGKGGAA